MTHRRVGEIIIKHFSSKKEWLNYHTALRGVEIEGFTPNGSINSAYLHDYRPPRITNNELNLLEKHARRITKEQAKQLYEKGMRAFLQKIQRRR